MGCKIKSIVLKKNDECLHDFTLPLLRDWIRAPQDKEARHAHL